MNTNSKEAIITSFQIRKNYFNSHRFEKGLEEITLEGTELMKNKIPDPNKKSLSFNLINEPNYHRSTNKIQRIKNYFQNIYETIKTIYQKI